MPESPPVEKQAIMSGYGSDLGEVLLSLGLVIALIFMLAWLVRRFSYKSFYQSEHIQVISSCALSTKERLMVVQVGDEQFLIGVSSGNIEKISRLRKNIEVSKEKPFTSKAFENFLDKAIKRTSSTND